VPGRVGNDELALGRGEVPVRHVDSDSLFALGAQAVRQQSQIGVILAAVAAGFLDRGKLIFKDRLRVEEQPSDERALAVVVTCTKF
jgi:hypothetical protein